MPHEKVEPEPSFEALIDHIQQTRGIDFRGYKRSSLRRRIELRMCEVGVEGFSSYQDFLEGNPQEFGALLDTVLINVTSFFRDPPAWAALGQQVIPQLVARVEKRQTVRIWSVGCASGEEPFSIAMLMAEALGVERFGERVKIYATDLDEAALRTARLATYTARDLEHLEPGLRSKYFEATAAGFLLQRELRKCVIFGRHNLVVDAPISRVDLLICRNLMIYLEAETQAAVLPRLHYALVDGGYLFLGTSETQLARSHLFAPTDMKHRIFVKVAQEWRPAAAGNRNGEGNGADLHTRLLESVVEASTVGYLAVDNAGLLVFANAGARRLLDVREKDVGRPFRDLPISYRPADLRSRIDDVMDTGKPARVEHLDFQRPGRPPMRLTVEVTPLLGRDLTSRVALLAFSDTTRLFALQTELQAAQENMETIIEELQSANEELETTNEELQSTNEELETTNEELRSTNEEADAVNAELQRRTEEAAALQAYADAVLRSIDGGLVVVDPDWTVRLWNRWGERVWGLRAEDAVGEKLLDLDIGVPLGRLHDRLSVVMVGKDARSECVLDGVDRRGRPLRCRVRIGPLTFADRSLHGAVLVMEDVTAEAGGPALHGDPSRSSTG